MPWEYEALRDALVPLARCPRCHTFPFVPFMRGQVISVWRKWLRRPYCCLICELCKEIVGYEKP